MKLIGENLKFVNTTGLVMDKSDFKINPQINSQIFKSVVEHVYEQVLNQIRLPIFGEIWFNIKQIIRSEIN